jgi:hypothetical protein
MLTVGNVYVHAAQLSSSRMTAAPCALIREFGDPFAGFRPRQLDLRAQRFRHLLGIALAARHPADVRWIAPHFLRNAIVDTSAQRGKTPQIRKLLIFLDVVHGDSQYC